MDKPAIIEALDRIRTAWADSHAGEAPDHYMLDPDSWDELYNWCRANGQGGYTEPGESRILELDFNTRPVLRAPGDFVRTGWRTVLACEAFSYVSLQAQLHRAILPGDRGYESLRRPNEVPHGVPPGEDEDG